MNASREELEKFFTKKTRPLPSEEPEVVLSWEARVPMLSNPVFMLDAAAAFLCAWFFPSVFFALMLNLSGLGPDAILYVISLVGICVAFLAGVCCLLVLFRFKNGYYAKYVISAAGVACEIAYEISPGAKPEGILFSSRASALPPGSVTAVKTHKWLTWDKIHKIKKHPALKSITLGDSYFPLLRIFCPDDAIFARAWEFCEATLASTGNTKENK